MVQIKSIPVEKINPAPYNPRKDLKPGDPEYEKLKRSIEEFGYVEPLVWNERTGHLVGGHQRFKILLHQGAKTVEVSIVDLDDKKERALNIALNKISGDWDNEKLREHINFEKALNRANIEVRAQIIWVKNVASFGFANYKWKHEPILYGGKAGSPINFHGNRKQTTVWNEHDPSFQVEKEKGGFVLKFNDGEKTFFVEVDSINNIEIDDPALTTVWDFSREVKYVHPTQKPIALVKRAIKNSSKHGQIVVDLFGGSGSTLMAAEETGRTCYTMELDEKFCDVIIKRWEEHTGKKAVVLDGPAS